jgi:hypothetical protein
VSRCLKTSAHCQPTRRFPKSRRRVGKKEMSMTKAVRRYLVLLFILDFFCIITNAQTTKIKGKILDEKDNSPLIGATITIKKSN